MVHYVRKYQLKNTVLMEATKSGRQVMDIHLSIEKMVSADYDPALILPLHAIIGCDTVAAYFGTLRRHSTKYPTETKKLSIIGDLTEDKDAVYSAVSDFLSRCYGRVPQEDMVLVRSKVWCRARFGVGSTPNLALYPSRVGGLQHQHTLLQNYKLYLQQRQHCCLIS